MSKKLDRDPDARMIVRKLSREEWRPLPPLTPQDILNRMVQANWIEARTDWIRRHYRLVAAARL